MSHGASVALITLSERIEKKAYSIHDYNNKCFVWSVVAVHYLLKKNP